MYAGSERIEQYTDRTNGGYERLLYVHEDLQGNTRYYTKENGQSFAELTYDAWGMPETPNKLLNNHHGNYVYATYTGHIFDTTLDIYFAEARFYDAATRQWLAMDPIKDGGNWYQYCYSNPLRYWDPNGLFVVGLGMDFSASASARGGIGAQIIVDDKFNVGIATYSAWGGGTPSIGLGGTITFSTANTIYDYGGNSLVIGGGINGAVVGVPLTGSIEVSVSLGSSPTTYAITFLGGPGVAFPVEAHAVYVTTRVKPILVNSEIGRNLLSYIVNIREGAYEYFKIYTGCV